MSSGINYIPSNDARFDEWLGRFVAYVGANYAELGLAQADAEALNAPQDAWSSAHVSYTAAVAALNGARAHKNTTRRTMESEVRAMVRRIQAYPGTTDAAREAMGITVYGAGKSDPSLPGGLARPIAAIEGTRQTHVIRVRTQTPTGFRRGKPAGAMGCEIFRKIGGEPPTDESELQYVGTATGGKYAVVYPLADGGKLVHYMMRFVDGKGGKSPWSQTESVIIAA